MRWSDYLDLAQELHGGAVGTPFEEAKLRSAISRAYYAVFNEGRDFLRVRMPRLLIPEDGRAHEFVADVFANDSRADWVTVGAKMGRLRQNRRKADYFPSVNGLLPLTVFCLQQASIALTTLKRL
jgi:uncharacterized protein (UPF0332 family)